MGARIAASAAARGSEGHLRTAPDHRSRERALHHPGTLLGRRYDAGSPARFHRCISRSRGLEPPLELRVRGGAPVLRPAHGGEARIRIDRASSQRGRPGHPPRSGDDSRALPSGSAVGLDRRQDECAVRGPAVQLPAQRDRPRPVLRARLHHPEGPDARVAEDARTTLSRTRAAIDRSGGRPHCVRAPPLVPRPHDGRRVHPAPRRAALTAHRAPRTHAPPSRRGPPRRRDRPASRADPARGASVLPRAATEHPRPRATDAPRAVEVSTRCPIQCG